MGTSSPDCTMRRSPGATLSAATVRSSSSLVAVGRGGGTFEEPAQVAIRPSGRPCFKRPSAGHHDADHGGGEILADGECADQGQESDEVHPDVSSAKAVHHRPERVGGPDGAGHDPDRVSRGGGSGQVECSSDNEAGACDVQEDDRQVPAEP